jgi:predicted nucleotidyltransferase
MGLGMISPVSAASQNNIWNPLEVDPLGGGFSSGGVAWGDFDKDGDLDILASGSGRGGAYGLRVYKNEGNGTFVRMDVVSANNGFAFGTVAWGDFDNDEDLDILVSGMARGSSYQIRVYENNGGRTFAPKDVAKPFEGLVRGGVAWGDFDNDGDLDVLASGARRLGNHQILVYQNNGDKTFTKMDVSGREGGLHRGGVAWGDFDNDGDLDGVISGMTRSGIGELRIYRNQGNKTFDSTPIKIRGSSTDSSVALGDFDNDGVLDILVSAFGNGRPGAYHLRLYRNGGNGNFLPINVVRPGEGFNASDVALGDFDNDGALDILVEGRQRNRRRDLSLLVYKNTGQGQFLPSDVAGFNNGLSLGSVACGDVDNDGDLDILASGSDKNGQLQLRVYKNTISIPNTAPSAPAVLASSFAFDPTGTPAMGSKSGNNFSFDNAIFFRASRDRRRIERR